ncbi:MAG: hypothetical protein BWY69_01731 [Planctomycetes bacterium ADurb.Bin401]|nr:MAG: hypothetical protein BWY69_01731 [Planctomycetes bacterium ADurb.Bin401]
MAVGRQDQSSTMLYTAIVFVGLFIIAAVVAVVFYIKAEDWRTQYMTSQQNFEQVASSSDVANISNLVGQKSDDSRVRQLLGYIDNFYTMQTGAMPSETTAEAKMLELQSKHKDVMSAAPKDFGVVMEANDVNGPGIFRIVELYNNKLALANKNIEQLNSQIATLNSDLDASKQGAADREQELLTQVGKLQEDANSVQRSYNQLRDLMSQKADEQMAALIAQREEAINERNKSRQELLEAMSKLTITQNRLEDALSRLDVLKPRPKQDVAAYKPDGSVISVDIQSNIVFIDIGADSKVYPGLTFAVYDRSAPIPTEGTSKGEIEIFDVAKNTATARITQQSKRNPVAEGDTIINLIWDSTATNTFVIAGEFDFNGNGTIDRDGAEKVQQLVENWGGKTEEAVTIDTDYVVLGTEPQILKKPTLSDIETDPLANDKYEASVKASERYQEVKTQAKDLYIPVFSLKRFLNFTGYESLAAKTK